MSKADAKVCNVNVLGSTSPFSMRWMVLTLISVLAASSSCVIPLFSLVSLINCPIVITPFYKNRNSYVIIILLLPDIYLTSISILANPDAVLNQFITIFDVRVPL